MGPRLEKICFKHIRLAKVQISHHIRDVWLALLLYADLDTYLPDSC